MEEKLHVGHNWVRRICGMKSAGKRKMVELREEIGMKRYLKKFGIDCDIAKGAWKIEQGWKERGKPGLMWTGSVKRCVENVCVKVRIAGNGRYTQKSDI